MNHLRLYRIIRGLFIVFISFIAMLLIVSFFLPSEHTTRARYLILSKPENVYPYIGDLKQWYKWNYWLKTGDSTLKARVTGEEYSPKQTLVWYSDESGNGSITITWKRPPRGVKYEIFIDENMFYVNGEFTLTEDPRGVLLTWQETFAPENKIFGKYALLLINVLAPQDHERSFKRLEKLLDASTLVYLQ
ncbi:MAG: SRPBCC family protein [Chloroflexota bacterium]